MHKWNNSKNSKIKAILIVIMCFTPFHCYFLLLSVLVNQFTSSGEVLFLVSMIPRQRTLQCRNWGPTGGYSAAQWKRDVKTVKRHARIWFLVDGNRLNWQKILNAAGKANKELYLHLLRIKEWMGHSVASKSKN